MRATGPSAFVRDTVIARSHGCCARCGRTGGQIHHRKPRRLGGTRDPQINLPSNLVLLDQHCHEAIESWRKLGYDYGWLLHANDDPTQVPIIAHGYRIWLDNEGDEHSEPVISGGPVIGETL